MLHCMVSDLDRSILDTITYFDIFGVLLTREQIARYLWRVKASYYEVDEALTNLTGVNKIICSLGYFHLPGREKDIEKHRAATLVSELKLRQARRAAAVLACLPFVRAVFVGNSVGGGYAEQGSDVDLLVVCAPRLVWAVRFFANSALRLFRMRVTAEHEAGRMCLSFFVDTNHLDLASYRVRPDDIYLVYWLVTLAAIYDPNNIHRDLLVKNNWIAEYLPCFAVAEVPYIPLLKKNRWYSFLQRMGEIIFTSLGVVGIENTLRRWQMRRLRSALIARTADADRGVILEAGVLKFHEHDRRQEFFDTWQRMRSKASVV